MRFKIKNTDVSISFTFFAVFLLSLVSDTFDIYLFSFIASLVHELVHIVFILLFGAHISKFSLTLFGGNIKRNTTKIIANPKEAVISFSAPVTNIVIGVVSLFINGKESVFAVVNLFIGIFNILPFYSFDGGRGLYYLITMKFSENVANTFLNITSITVTVAFSFISVFVFINYNKNYLLLILSVYMILSIIVSLKDHYY